MSRGSDLGALLSGIAIGAAAVFFSSEKNREKVRVGINKATEEITKFSKEYQEDPEKAIDQLKEKAGEVMEDVEKNARAAGKQLSEASRKQMIAALDKTEEELRAARKALEHTKPAPATASQSKLEAKK